MSKERIEELEKQMALAIENRDKYQKEISDLWVEIRKLKVGDIDDAIRSVEWRYEEENYKLLGGYGYQRWCLRAYENESLKYFLENGGSIELMPNVYMCKETPFTTLHSRYIVIRFSGYIVIRFYNADVSDVGKLIDKYKLKVNFDSIKYIQEHVNKVLLNDRT